MVFLHGNRKLCFMLHLGRLRALCEVASRGTIAAAADALALTPSAVSQQLAALERELGQRLVEPDGRSVRLTPVAQVLVRRAEGVFAELESVRAEMAEHVAGERGDVRLGAFATGITRLVAPAAAALAHDAPGIRLEVVESEAPEAFTRLARRELDVVVSMEAPGAPTPDDPKVTRIELGADPLEAMLGESHPLAGSEAVALADLRADPWVAPLPGWACEQVIVAACRAACFTPRICHRAGDWVAMRALVGAGLGVGLVPRLAGLSSAVGAVLVPLRDPVPARQLFVACRRGAEGAPVVRAVLDALLASGRRAEAVGTA